MGRRNQNAARTQQEKRTNFHNHVPKSHTQTVQEKYQKGGPKDKNGYHTVVLSAAQEKASEIIQENTLTFLVGPAGTGKTQGALVYAVKGYVANPHSKIIVIRTPVESGSDRVGFLPSDLAEKIAPHFSSVKIILEDLLTPEKVDADMNGPNKRIQFLIPNYALGCTYNDSIVIIDEAQMIQPLIMKLLLERIGTGSKVIVIGDPTQLYALDSKDADKESRSRNGLSDALHRFFVEDEHGVLIPRYGSCGAFFYHVDDMMRSDFVKTVIKAYSAPV